MADYTVNTPRTHHAVSANGLEYKFYFAMIFALALLVGVLTWTWRHGHDRIGARAWPRRSGHVRRARDHADAFPQLTIAATQNSRRFSPVGSGVIWQRGPSTQPQGVRRSLFIRRIL
jgi:hypothetical protein